MATAAATFLVGGAPAFADTISNNLDAIVDAAAETMSLAPGGAVRTTELRVIPTDDDGKAGCNLTGQTTLTTSVSSSNTSVATVSPASVTFTSCGDVKTLTVTSGTPGTARISLAQTANTTGRSFDLAPATFDVVVAATQTDTTTTISCPTSVVYTGAARTPCSATTTGTGGFSTVPTLVYSANTVVGTASVTATYAGDATHRASSDTKTFAIAKAGSTTTLECSNGTYTGGTLTPCNATVAGVGTLTGTASITYSNNVDAGTASATATYAGDANHGGSTADATFTIGQAAATCAVTPYSGTYDGATHGLGGSCTFGGTSVGVLDLGGSFTSAGTHEVSWSFEGGENFGDQSGTSTVTIAKAPTTTAVTCPSSRTYTGSAIAPCTARATGPGLDASVDVSYATNTNVGTATASASYAGGTNWLPSVGNGSFQVTKATTTVTVDCPTSRTYTGSAIAPCSARATGPALDQALTVGYSGNLDVGTATASASYDGDANHWAQAGSATFAITPAPSVVTVTCDPATVAYTGAAQTPCTAEVTGVGGLRKALTPTYADNTNAGTARASATYDGDANHDGDTGSATFTIAKAPSTTTVTCPSSVSYDGTAQEPCSASAGGIGMADVTGLAVSYSHNTNAGTATATASYGGDANHEASDGEEQFEITKAASTTSVTCPANVKYTGLPRTPCSASVSGVGGLSVELAPSYMNNVDAGTATASATYGGGDNHDGSTASKDFTIDKAPSTVTLTCPTSVVYDGTPHGCTAVVGEAGSVTGTATLVYSEDRTNVGTVTVTATYAGDSNHTGSSAEGSFEITKAASSVVVTCPTSVTYTGTAHTPCTAKATGVGMADVTGLAVTHGANTDAGTASAEASWAGDRNHTASTGSARFTIAKATSTVTVTCPAGPFYFTGSPVTPACTARATGAGSLDVAVTPVTFGNNMTVGTATASATYGGDANHTGSTGSTTFSVSAWTLSGFFAPVDRGIHNTVKAGATVPLKFRVFAGSTEITDTAKVSFKTVKISCTTGAEDAIEEYFTSGSTTLRYDTTGAQFIQSWQTPKAAGTCYRATVTTLDGSTISADFKLK